MVKASDERQIYELGYLLSPLFPAEQVAEAVDSLINKAINDRGGEVGDELAGPKMIRLAYPIKKMIENKNQTFKEAYFGSRKFALSPEAVTDLREAFGASDKIVRFIILRLPGATLNNPQPEPKPELAPVAGKNVPEPITQEVIDREIEELLA